MPTFTNKPEHASRVRRAVFIGVALIAATATVVTLNAALASSATAASVKSASRAAAVVVARDAQIVRLAAIATRANTARVADVRAAQAADDARAAAAAAAAAAAQAAAEQAARAASAHAVAPRSHVVRAAAGRVVNVWIAGWQDEINDCRGAVDVTAHYGARTIAEHWGCGGASFPTAPGSVVTITGLDAGTYSVIGRVAVLDAYTANTSQIPQGYSLLFQTCLNNDSHTTEFIALQPAG